MPRFLVFPYDIGEGYEAATAATAIGQATSPGLGSEYVVINLDDMSVSWHREVRALLNRDIRKIESADGISQVQT